MSLRVLVLCTGNICRSPAGELLLQEAFGPALQVSSAGTHALTGHPIEPQMASLLPPGIDSSGFAARQLRAPMVRDADLVLAMTRAHRTIALEEFPGALRRTFTLLELARVLQLPGIVDAGASPADRLATAVPRAAARRSDARAQHSAQDDVSDPYRRGDEAFRQAYADIEQAVAAIAEACGAISPPA